LEAGQRLGPYQITSFIAAGGMGEVYCARDIRLGRSVAIKVMTRGLTAGANAIERFQREARAASSLNHPNICTIYDVGTDPPFIAMELLEGETLQQRLAHGPFDTSVAVDTAVAIADALTAAHGTGIVHRDIKPANIFLTAYGPKVLDFGLAKALEAAEDAAASYQATRSGHAPLTGSGVTVGTVAYMSPEQLKGEGLDERTDLFSLGMVLFEMVVGRPAFTGSTNAVLSAAILHDTPPPARTLRPDIPPILEQIITRALEKDRDVRYQTAADFRAELRRLKRVLDSKNAQGVKKGSKPRDDVTVPHGLREELTQVDSGQTSLGGPTPSDAQMAVALIKRHRGLTAAGALIIVSTVSLLYVWSEQRTTPTVATTAAPTLEDLTVTQLTTSGKAERASISPDGKYVAYIRHEGDKYGLWIRQTATDSNVQIVAPEPGVVLRGTTVTPDGAFVDFIRGYELWRIPFLGGVAKRLIDRVDTPVAWSPDGRHMAFVRADWEAAIFTLMVADADGSHERTVAERHPPNGILGVVSFPNDPHVRPAWSPDGQVIAISATRTLQTSNVVFVDAVTGAERAVPIQGAMDHGLGWIDTRSLVFSLFNTRPQLWRMSYPEGRIFRLTNDVNAYVGVSLTADHNELVTTRTERHVGISIGDAAGSNLVDAAQTKGYLPIAFTWADDRLLFSTNEIMRISGSRGKIEPVLGSATEPTATRDGRSMVFMRFEPATDFGIWKADSDGRNAVRLIDRGFHPIVTRDNQNVLFSGPNVSMIPLAGGAPRIVADLSSGFVDASPDGTSIVVGIDSKSGTLMMLCELPTCSKRRTLVPTPAATNLLRIRYVPDGRGIAYVDAATQSNLWVQPIDGGAARQLTHFTDGRLIDDYAWSRDGKRLAIARAIVTNDIVLFKGLKK
jgi:serine/threonine protein kinase/Tol biopolymer transport system component